MSVDICKDLKKYIPIFQQAAEQGINESDTSLRIGKFLEDVLGYDMFSDISKEFTVKDRFVDYAIKINNKIVFFIEVKQAGMELRSKHIEQASNYAANAGVDWVILTNGTCWHLYHLTFEDGIQNDLVFSTDILKDTIDTASTKISLLHKKAVSKGEYLDYFDKIKTLEPENIMGAVFHEDTLRIIRNQLKKMTGVRIEEEELVNGIKQMISKDTWERIGDIKIKRQKKISKVKKDDSLATNKIADVVADIKENIPTEILLPPEEKNCGLEKSL
jgi:predicted type IV restriction endonuclease